MHELIWAATYASAYVHQFQVNANRSRPLHAAEDAAWLADLAVKDYEREIQRRIEAVGSKRKPGMSGFVAARKAAVDAMYEQAAREDAELAQRLSDTTEYKP
jgi:hypothetical protein